MKRKKRPASSEVSTDAADLTCPFCGESCTITIDAGGGGHQTFVDDCEVCCRPRLVHVEAFDPERPPNVWLERDDGF